MTIGYLLWSLIPVVIAVIFSFNAGRSRSTWQGFSMRWWTGDPFDSLFHDPSAPHGDAADLPALDHHGADRGPARHGRSRSASTAGTAARRAAANFVMLLSFVVPEIILGVSLFLLFTNLLKNLVPLGTPAQVLGLATFQMSYPVIIVRARLLSIGPEYEEAAMDLGAKPGQSIRRVLLPLLSPAILASVAADVRRLRRRLRDRALPVRSREQRAARR